MGTVMNGNVWASACANGKVVSGLAKNGVVFYKKPVSTYKRRIMSTDNLEGKTIFFDFPDNYGDIITTPTSSFLSFFNLYFSDITSTGYLSIRSHGSRTIFIFDELSKINLKQLTVTSEFGKLYSVTDCESYRHCWVEDENIRPLKVGDVITRNTKFYFTIPDNIFEQLPQGSDDLIILNNGESISLYAYSFSSSIYFDTTSGMDTNMNIITVINGNLMVNKSTMQNISYNGDYFEGTVSEVNNSSPVYSMILVDTTTLGA